MAVERGTAEQQTLEGRSVARTAETSATAVSATAKAMVEAKFLVALNRPRNFDAARTRLLKTCGRPRFAGAARYSRPVGKSHVEGMSIRFADEAVKELGNIETRQEVIYEDDDQRIVQVCVTDLETNLSKTDTVCIRKVVERKNPKSGQEIIGKRENSYGDTVFLVRASDDELITKEANLCAKKRRNLELQIIPQDLIEECEEAVQSTLRNQYAKDPDGERKALLDGFAALGIMPEQLQEYLGHSTKAITPAEFDTLRKIGASLRDNHTTWDEVMDAKNGTAGKGDRGSVDLDDILPGDADTHNPVDAPIVGEYAAAYAKLSGQYDDLGGQIDAELSKCGLVSILPDISRDTKDESIQRAVIEVAALF